jgi:hypothetical protein
MTKQYGLGRYHLVDERDAAYPASLHLEAINVHQSEPITKSWRPPVVRLDQGDTSACVGFAAENWIGTTQAADTIVDPVTNAAALEIYADCKAVDGMPGLDGTSDRFLAQTLLAENRITRYLWAQTMSEILLWISYVGPVMVGTQWTQDMFAPQPTLVDSLRRYLLRPTGSVVGGHEWMIYGNDQVNKMVVMRNSWGDGWALFGEAWIRHGDLAALLFTGSGDALCAVKHEPTKWHPHPIGADGAVVVPDQAPDAPVEPVLAPTVAVDVTPDGDNAGANVLTLEPGLTIDETPYGHFGGGPSGHAPA